MFKIAIAASMICLVLSGCAAVQQVASPTPQPQGFQALGQDMTATAAVRPALADYRLGVFDKIGVTVYQMPELSNSDLQVDANGQIMMPQVGSIVVAGKTTDEVNKDITTKLSACCLVNPQVNVTLKEALSQQVTVTGAVRTPNIYMLRGRTTLQQVLAMAGGVDSEKADLKSVAIIRTTNGQRMGAKFNLDEINRGTAADPEIVAGDTVIVDQSGAKSAFRTILQAIPLVGVFTLL